MWKRLWRKTSDIFFEDVVIEEQIKGKESPNQKDITDKNVKMTSTYSKSTQFRFPIIPDSHVEKPSINQGKSKSHQSIPSLENKRRQTKRVTSSYTSMKRMDLAYGYRKQKALKELEDIPAYMRKQKEKQMFTESSTKEAESIPVDLVQHVYSNPDELDRIFKKKNAIEKQEMTINKSNEINKSKADKEIPAFLRRQKTKTMPEPTLKQKIKEDIVTSPLIEDTSIDTNIEQAVEVPNERTKMEAALPGYLLDDPDEDNLDDSVWLEEQKWLLEETLSQFKIDATVVKVTQGPAVTRLEIQPALGVRVNKIRNLSDDIKLNMAAKDIRMEAPIPGKNTIGIEIPNEYPQVVGLQEIIETEEFDESTSPLTIALGLTIEGEPLITNIEKMPHGLIAGATGSGKSVCINAILLSLLYKTSHEELKLLLIDPKMVELAPYNGIPHLISPVITDAKAATIALKWAVDEMEDRYNRLAEAKVRNIKSFNNKMINENKPENKMPYIVIVIDELADLMIVSPQDVEDAICRIAQKARACGIHLLVATQRPSVDVITGLIKANIPTRIAFSVSSQIDSRTMIDTVGAEKLLGKGDMLFVENGSSKNIRLQGPFVSDEEIDRVTNYFRSIATPNYLFKQDQLLLEVQDENEDELLDEIISFVLEQNQASTSLLQRHFRIGYNRAARLIDTLESKGIVSGPNGSKPRDILITKSQINEQFTK